MNPKTSFHNICIIGNIGSGKSTLAALLAQAIPDSVLIPEVFDQNPFLIWYVADPPRWAFTNAVRYFYDYARVYRELNTGHNYAHCFIDAGGSTNRHIYGRYLLNEKVMTPEENAFYETLCKMIERQFDYPEPDAFIYAAASPETCFARMQARGWEYQTEHIMLDYLTVLRGYFESYRDTLRAQGVPLLELDSEKLDFMNAEGQREALARVQVFLEHGNIQSSPKK